ncbi:uncharacterized protein LOC129618879 [Condylostylus longicornis]|uniref:uncharacterized protein LOC129618879 n=1 Tax=Condylostylus longicornis TaxID=2530218 RepID=UPI00244E3274|nr:uncharacterized protein LOC129618879 [Condylostylus longicornis]
MKMFWLNFIFILNLTFQINLGEIVMRNSYTRKNFADKDHPGRCVIPELDLILSAGVIKNPDPDSCEQIYCSSNGMAMFIACPPVFVEDEDNCWIGDLTSPQLPFPECCKRQIHCSSQNKRRRGARMETIL